MRKEYYILFILALVVYALNLSIDVMVVDAAQYAEMSWEMFTTKSFLQVHCLHQDYLDKPPLLFWLNSLSFWVFGVGNASYKLPSLLFALLAVYATFRFAKIYYSLDTAAIAALMLATTQALFLITNDVRTDTLLMGAVIFAIWQWAAFLEEGKTKHLIWGSIGIGVSLLTKGPIGLITVGAAILPQLLLRRRLNRLFDWRILASMFIIGLMLLPMCIGLYQQWGLKGLQFYFWTQSFGRVTGASEWNNHPDTFFLLHTTAWAFLPWTLFLVAGWGKAIWGLFNSGLSSRKEWISFSGFTLVIPALMLSKYQLPHYVFVVYPLGAVIAADYFVQIKSSTAKRIITGIQVLTLLAMIAVIGLLQYCFKGSDVLSLTMLIILYPLTTVLLWLWDGKNKLTFDKLLIISAGIMIVSNIMISAFYFPAIMKYQPDDDFGRYVRQHGDKANNFVTYDYGVGFTNIFYAQQWPLSYTWDIKEVQQRLTQKKHLIICTTPGGLETFTQNHIQYKIIEARYAFNVAKPTFDFLNPATRNSQCRTVYLIEAVN